MGLKQAEFISWNRVRITRGFWHRRMEINEKVTLPAEYEQCRKSGRLDSVKCLYKEESRRSEKGELTIDGVLAENMAEEGRIPRPHHYWDSDLAKWIEAAAYSLLRRPDARTEEKIDTIVEDFEKLQQADGYLNTYYTVVEPGKRWTNVYRMHELYCAGHLIEAAAAYYTATGKKKLLDIVCRYADHIDRTFGPEEGKIHGYPGHQEIELALVKLYRLTGEKRYLELALYFINERGKKPYFFETEAIKYGRDPEDGGPKGILGKHYLAAGPYALFQSHLPVREQKRAEGHAVRLTYMGCAMADLAAETGDESLWEACRNLWKSAVGKRMYITGGVGSQEGSERFCFDYHLPNEEAYQETCASVGMVMWAGRMLQIAPDRRYGDVMERALYNSVISGVSLKGDTFFYANHLAAKPGMFSDREIRNPRMFPVRQSWFAVSCCPMNLARLTESIGGYIYTENADTLYIHLFIDSETVLRRKEGTLRVRMETEYPWKNRIRLKIRAENPLTLCLSFRNPGFSKNTRVRCIAGEELRPEELTEENGYFYLKRCWSGESVLEICLDMRPELLEAHPYVRMNAGKAAIQYGPLIYCLEEADNGGNLETIYLKPSEEMAVRFEPKLLGGVCVVEGNAVRKQTRGWEEELYRPLEGNFETVRFRAIPYYAWSNRTPGEMLVWVNVLQKCAGKPFGEQNTEGRGRAYGLQEGENESGCL